MSEAESREAHEFLRAIEALCGEANEAARLAESLFDGAQKVQVRRALARCMELMDTDVLPVFRGKFGPLSPEGSASR
jgi:hypothetical protein